MCALSPYKLTNRILWINTGQGSLNVHEIPGSQKTMHIKPEKYQLLILLLSALVFHACSRYTDSNFNFYVLKSDGNNFYIYPERKNNQIHSINKPQRLPASGTLSSSQQSRLHLQLHNTLSLILLEQSNLKYEILPGGIDDPWNFQVNLSLISGAMAVSKSNRFSHEEVYYLINDFFFPKNEVIFLISRINETEDKMINNYITVSILDGSLHYISPITGKIDMLISEKHQFTVKNRIPREVLSLSAQELSQLESYKNLKTLNLNQVESILYGRSKYWDVIANQSRFPAILFIGLSLLFFLSYRLYLLYLDRNHTYRGQVNYTNFTKLYADKQSVRFNRLTTKNKIFIGRYGYCQVKIPGWKKKRRVVIVGKFREGKETYTMRRARRDVIFLKRENVDELRHGDQFIIDNYEFEFVIKA